MKNTMKNVPTVVANAIINLLVPSKNQFMVDEVVYKPATRLKSSVFTLTTPNKESALKGVEIFRELFMNNTNITKEQFDNGIDYTELAGKHMVIFYFDTPVRYKGNNTFTWSDNVEIKIITQKQNILEIKNNRACEGECSFSVAEVRYIK